MTGRAGACGPTLITRALYLGDMDPDKRKMTQAITSDLVMDFRALAECVEDMGTGDLAGDMHIKSKKVKN